MSDTALLIAAAKRLGYDEPSTLRLVEAVEEERRERSRRAAANRQRARRDSVTQNTVTKERDCHAEHRDTVTVTQNTVTEPSPYKDNHARACVFPVGLSNDSPPNKIITPLPSEGPHPNAKKQKRQSGACLPDDWSPSEELFDYGAERGLTRGQTSEILEDMRIWAGANSNRAIARKADWNLTAKGFIRRDAAKFKARAGPSTQRDYGKGALAKLIRNVDESIKNEQLGQTKGEISGGNVLSLPVVSGVRGRSSDDDDGVYPFAKWL